VTTVELPLMSYLVGVTDTKDLNYRQKWDVCLKPNSKTIALTESPDKSSRCAASILSLFNHSWGVVWNKR
jgi:hypothetical protein